MKFVEVSTKRFSVYILHDSIYDDFVFFQIISKIRLGTRFYATIFHLGFMFFGVIRIGVKETHVSQHLLLSTPRSNYIYYLLINLRHRPFPKQKSVF